MAKRTMKREVTVCAFDDEPMYDEITWKKPGGGTFRTALCAEHFELFQRYSEKATRGRRPQTG